MSADLRQDEVKGSLRAHGVSGVKWTGVATLIAAVLQYSQLLVLARILEPSDFGLMAMVSVVLSLAGIYSDLGVSNAIITRHDATREQLSSLYWLNVGGGVVVFGLVVAIRPLVVLFYREPRLTPLLLLAGLTLFIAAVGRQFGIMLQKDFQFRRAALITIAAAAASATVAITTALLGEGVRALIWGGLTSSGVSTLLLVGTARRVDRPKLHFARKDLKGYVGFGAYQMGERSLHVLSSNVDYLLVGRFLGPEALGIYSLAYQLVIQQIMRINWMFTGVGFPIFSRRQDDDAALRGGLLELSRMIGFFIFPVLLGLAATAPVLIPLAYGERWTTSVVLVQILVPVGILWALDSAAGSVLLAKGRADILFKWNLVWLLVLSLAMYLAVRSGLTAVAWAWVAAYVAVFPFYREALRRVCGLRWGEFLTAIRWPLFAAGAMGALVYGLYLLLSQLGIKDAFVLTALIAAGVAVYGGLWVLHSRDYLLYLKDLILSRLPRDT